MKIAPISAAMKRRGWNTWAKPASAVPTSTGAIAAGRVRIRAAISQMRIPLGAATALIGRSSRPPGELREVGFALLDVRPAALLGLLAHVEEEVGVVGELLNAAEAVLIGV